MNVLITGAAGFVGKNLSVALRRKKDIALLEFDLGNKVEDLRQFLATADIIFHLAGVNRPKDIKEYESGNIGFSSEICKILQDLKRAPKIVFSSSIQAELDNPYGASKRAAEEALRAFAESTGVECVIYRLKNLFGKWCRPNYNSVTATYCYNVAHDLPIQISDPSQELELTYIDEVIVAFLNEISTCLPGFRYAESLPSYRVTLQELAETIRSFRAIRSHLQLPDFSSPFIRALYPTYVSYLEKQDFSYNLEIKSDPRGGLAEFIKAAGFGQIFISRTHPGTVRGNHFHQTKTEKFFVLQGDALIRFRHVLEDEVIEYRVNGGQCRVVDIPPGYTHSIENVGKNELITLFWSNEVFDPDRPDTFYEEV
jgi:UDP-2-acetamido-2,6-beta-L-arabino-hexul-4-ose reductase